MTERASKWLNYLLYDQPPAEVTPTSGVDVLIPGLETLSVAPTGCAMHMKKTTIIAFYVASAAHVDLVLQHTHAVATMAKANHNHVIYAVLGVADDADAVSWLLQTLPENRRVLLAGASELKHSSDVNSAWKAYLQEADLVAFVPAASNSTSGTWLLPSSGDACLGLVPQGSMLPREWAEAVNSLPRDKVKLDRSSNLPFARIGADSGITLSTDMQLSLIQRSVEWVVSDPRDVFCWPDTKAVWSTLARGAIPSWTVTSSCAKTIAAMTIPPLRMDRQLTIFDLQYDVSLTLASFISQTSSKFDSLKGVIGPVVISGRLDDEPLRCIEWVDPSKPKDHVLMLLPEAYVRLTFPDYDGPEFGSVQWLSSFLCLSNANAISLRVQGCQAEADEVTAQMGTRLWRVPEMSADTDLIMSTLQRQEVVRSTIFYKTQQDAARVTDQAGIRLRSSTHTVFYTNTSSRDHLAGLRVRWVFAADRPTMPTLDADNREGGAQLPYETVA